jgi:hypothetical protein
MLAAQSRSGISEVTGLAVGATVFCQEERRFGEVPRQLIVFIVTLDSISGVERTQCLMTFGDLIT